jgi:hypothetical protein
MTLTAEVEVVLERNGDAYGFSLKATATGMMYRITPARDPRQPRFWSVMIYRCSSGVLADPAERPWFDGGGHRREELHAVMREIRDDPEAWLVRAANDELRTWMLAPRVEPATQR